MAYFPLYMDIGDKNCIVIGGGRVAESKIRKLLEFGGRVTVIAPEVTGQIAEWEKEGMICIKQREFLADDIADAAVVIAAADRQEVHESAAALCAEKKIPINVVDDKELCTFFFPAIVKRGDVVVSISTGGKSPALAAKIRRELETCIPDSYGTAAEIMGRYRDDVMEHLEDSRIRKQIFEEMLEEVLARGDMTKKDVEEFLRRFYH